MGVSGLWSTSGTYAELPRSDSGHPCVGVTCKCRTTSPEQGFGGGQGRERIFQASRRSQSSRRGSPVALTSTDVGACGSHRGKLPHDSHQSAWVILKRMLGSGMSGRGLQVYFCPDCHLFFIGGALPRQVNSSGCP
jgi:hypothetical protein